MKKEEIDLLILLCILVFAVVGIYALSTQSMDKARTFDKMCKDNFGDYMVKTNNGYAYCFPLEEIRLPFNGYENYTR